MARTPRTASPRPREVGRRCHCASAAPPATQRARAALLMTANRARPVWPTGVRLPLSGAAPLSCLSRAAPHRTAWLVLLICVVPRSLSCLILSCRCILPCSTRPCSQHPVLPCIPSSCHVSVFMPVLPCYHDYHFPVPSRFQSSVPAIPFVSCPVPYPALSSPLRVFSGRRLVTYPPILLISISAQCSVLSCTVSHLLLCPISLHVPRPPLPAGHSPVCSAGLQGAPGSKV